MRRFFIVDAPIQCASFYVERIDLTSKLRKLDQNGKGIGHFQPKSPLTNFQILTHQIIWLTHFKQTFSLKN